MSTDSKLLEKLKTRPKSHPTSRPLEPIADPLPKAVIVGELQTTEVLVDTAPENATKGFKVFHAVGRDIPQTILELGRLREETFRSVGEGSGFARDVDRFDPYYDHLIAWDKARGEITGSYRIGRMDEIIAERGFAGVYTNTLFNLESLLATDFKSGTLEAGRSFVRAEFQRGPTLLVVWMALSRFLVLNPKYKNLVGAVSISDEFQENSKRLMVSYLMKHYRHEKAAPDLSKNPPVFDSNLSPEELTSLVDAALDLKGLQEFVKKAENNPKAQIPQLIKLYLDLGCRFLAFNKDADFNSIDGLIVIDIPRIPYEVLSKYMGEEESKSYYGYHGVKVSEP